MMGARLHGDRALARELRRLRRETPGIVRDILEDWGGAVQRGAQRRVPILSGRLQHAIETRGGGNEMETGVWHVETDAPANYAGWTEMGNSRQEAQPFLFPAFESGNRGVEAAARKALRKRVRG